MVMQKTHFGHHSNFNWQKCLIYFQSNKVACNGLCKGADYAWVVKKTLYQSIIFNITHLLLTCIECKAEMPIGIETGSVVI